MTMTAIAGDACTCGRVHRPRLNDEELALIVASLEHRVKMYERLGSTDDGKGEVALRLLSSLSNMAPGAHSQRRYQ